MDSQFETPKSRIIGCFWTYNFQPFNLLRNVTLACLRCLGDDRDDTNLKQIILRPWPKRQEALDDGTQQTIASRFNHQMYEVLIWIRFTRDLKEVIHDWLYYPAMAMVCMKHRVLYFTKVVDNDRIPCHRCKPFPRKILLPKLRLGCACTAAGHSATAGTAGTARRHVKGSAMAAHGNMRELHSWVSDECDQMGCRWMQVSLLKTGGCQVLPRFTWAFRRSLD